MSAIPKCYKAAAVTQKGGSLELISVDWKEPQAGQIVVKVLACSVCHSDVFVQAQVLPTGLPRVPGHEIVGEVAAVHSSEKFWKVGQRVGSGWHGGHCFTCGNCRSGDFLKCHQGGVNGIFLDGGYAEYMTIRSEAVVSIPDTVDPALAAPLLCSGVTAFNALRKMQIPPGALVAVQGIGGMGHLAIQYCKAMGYRTVALSSSGSKEAIARELGAHEYLDGSKVNQAEELQKMGGAKAIIATAPNIDVVEPLVAGLGLDGQLVILTLMDKISIPIFPLIDYRLQIRGFCPGGPKDSEDCIAFSHVTGVKPLIQRFTLDNVNEAFTSMLRGDVRFKAVIIP
ncbi:hypothetical protein JAAARDRAFT_40354 [Jaapia argillacea MUCL 33604]|uniref:Enoyl reductase (ER) domain-containing protein n=1 Tax=Jaapia argillacea MUCL 33604 TaxID=933084 RepID=A0A067PBS8_9AGAM|nr:hypothetical protein JAAARDRAFT_40354 [Jaapia argillacea MUCL 33604]